MSNSSILHPTGSQPLPVTHIRDDATGMGDGHWLSEQSKLQEGKTHVASQGGFGDHKNEGDKSEALLG